MSNTNKFKVGDVVEAYGVRGVIETAERELFVRFDNEETDFFNTDGKLLSWHKEPSLKFISREEQKITMTKQSLIDVYKKASSDYVNAKSSIHDFPFYLVKAAGFKDEE